MRGTVGLGQIDVVLDGHGNGVLIDLQLAELLLETDLAHGELRRGQREFLESQLTGLVHEFDGVGRPQFARIGVTVQIEPVPQIVALAGIVHEDRSHPGGDGHPPAFVGHVVGDAVLTLARCVDVDQGCTVAEVQHVHGRAQEVSLHGGRRGGHIGVRMERRQNRQLLAVLGLAGGSRADPRQIGRASCRERV